MYYILLVEIISTVALLAPVKPVRNIASRIVGRVLSNFYLGVGVKILGVLIIIIFLDSWHESRKAFQLEGIADSVAYCQKQILHFRAQRNYYISGFALFLSFVISRACSIVMMSVMVPMTAPAMVPVTAPATVPVTGPIAGPVTGPVTGPATGPMSVSGHMPVPVTGHIPGPVKGPLPAPVTGPGNRADVTPTPRIKAE